MVDLPSLPPTSPKPSALLFGWAKIRSSARTPGPVDETGKLLVVREDVGRHNGVDKAIGAALMGGLFPLERCILLISGRASFEIM